MTELLNYLKVISSDFLNGKSLIPHIVRLYDMGYTLSFVPDEDSNTVILMLIQNGTQVGNEIDANYLRVLVS